MTLGAERRRGERASDGELDAREGARGERADSGAEEHDGKRRERLATVQAIKQGAGRVSVSVPDKGEPSTVLTGCV